MADTYTRTYRDFRGVDFSSKRSECDPHRFNYLVNMWRDYHSEQGAGVETAPGFRMVLDGDATKTNSLHYLPGKSQGDTGSIILHRGTNIYCIPMKDLGVLNDTDTIPSLYTSANDATSRALLFRDNLYMVDGKNYISISGSEKDSEGKVKVTKATDAAYVPTTFLNGIHYEQKNILTDEFFVEYTETEDEIFYLSEIVPAYDTRELYAEADHPAFEELQIICTRFITADAFSAAFNNINYSDSGSHHIKITAENGDVVYHEVLGQTDTKCPTCNSGNTCIDNLKILELEDTSYVYGKKIEKGNYEATYQQKVEDYHGFTSVTKSGSWYYYIDDDGKYVPLILATRENVEEKMRKNNTLDYPLDLNYFWETEYDLDGKEYITALCKYMIEDGGENIPREKVKRSKIRIYGFSTPNTFSSSGDFKDLLSGNPDFPREYTAKEAINGCTLIAEFDGRIFFSGNPKLPNSVFYTQRDLTGYNNPFYIGCYNYLNDGTGRTPITSMITTPTQLIVLKDHVTQGSSIYYHYAQDNPAETKVARDLQPRIYPRENGVPGLGCLGVACNFLDDPVFISPYGLEAIGKSQVNLERTLAHRSSMVDARLINDSLRGARCAEWDGYLCILVPGGKMYLADSRQVFTHKTGDQQYEWYYWEGIGVWEGQVDRYYYMSYYAGAPTRINGKEVAWDKATLPYEGEAAVTKYTDGQCGYVEEGDYVYLVDCYGEKIGGKFQEATSLLSADGLLYFGCVDGSLCVFNTDMRDEDHLLKPEAFTQNGRRYLSGCATLSDDCGRANLVKSTVRGSLAVVTKSFPYALVDVRVRTNAVPWYECDKIYAGEVDFNHTDFGRFAFAASDYDCIAIVREREKRWVEKQLYFLTECYESPFGLISATYDYKIAGRHRNG